MRKVSFTVQFTFYPCLFGPMAATISHKTRASPPYDRGHFEHLA
jgi:hypothetical protein